MTIGTIAVAAFAAKLPGVVRHQKHVWIPVEQLSNERRQTLESAICVAVFGYQVLALDVPKVAYAT